MLSSTVLGRDDFSNEMILDSSMIEKEVAVGELISKANVDVDTSTIKANNILNNISTKASVTEADAATSAATVTVTITTTHTS